MRIANLVALSLTLAAIGTASPSRADVVDPSGGSSSTATTSNTQDTSDQPNSDEGGCSVAFVRNTSAVAAGVIALALALGMARLRRYGIKRID